ncbi:MAG: alkaline phosphatase D family protein [Burkholderiales bacterium]|nr:alkaline phosphatase D family protein [Burkholderiales bacterium]
MRQLAAVSVAFGAGSQLSGCKLSHAQALSPTAFSFLHGVASGDPWQDRVILWTRVTPGENVVVDDNTTLWVQWQVAHDRQMQQIVTSGSVLTGAGQDFTVKVDAAGLQPGQEYFYRFTLAPEGGASVAARHSIVGRTKTLPADDVEKVRLAVFTCSNYPAGYFNVFADAAKQGGFDVALHLGDYIYEYEADGYACDLAQKLGRVSQPENILLDLDDYRTRYAQYRSDPDLQALHAQVPFICVWDDHEFADDTWRDGSADHNSLMQGPFSLRRAAAMQAYHEWLPIRTAEIDKIYRSFNFGQVLSLYMLDTRVVGRDQQLQFSSYCNSDGKLDLASLRRDAHSPQRQMLGKEQFAWLEQEVEKSSARWQVLGQQVLMARMEFPLPVALGKVDRFSYAAACVRSREANAVADDEILLAREKAWLSAPRVPCYLDSWDGYQAERERVFSLMQKLHKNLVVLAGDTHNAWAADLQDHTGRAVGVEFAAPSVSSPGLECSYPEIAPQKVANAMCDMIPALRYAQTSLRGYMIIEADSEEVRCDWRFVDTVHHRNFQAETKHRMRVIAGQRKLTDIPKQ